MIVKTTADRISTVVSSMVLYCHADRNDHPGETIYSPVSNDYWKNALDYYSSSSSSSLPRTRVVMVNDVIADSNDKEEFINEWLKKYSQSNRKSLKRKSYFNFL